MPIYEYRCTQCGAVFSHLWPSVKAAEEASQAGKGPVCPACGHRESHRIISQVTVLGGLGGLTPAEQAQVRAKEERLASITPREQIDKLQAKGREKRRKQS